MEKDYKHEMPYRDDWKRLSGKLPVKMTNDYLFRALLQADEKTLIALIASLLHLRTKDVKSVLITNPIELGESIDDKEINLDVSVVLNNEKKVNLEMQVAHEEGWVERTLLYISRSFDQLNHGEMYDEAKPVIQISFTDFTLFEEEPEFYATYMWINRKKLTQVYSDKMVISNVNLSRIDLATEEDKKYCIDKWAKIFKATTWEELKMLATADKNTEQAISSIWQLTEEEKIRDQIRYREEREREHNHLIDKLKRLENQVAENEIMMAEKDNRIAEKDNTIAEFTVELSEKESKLSEQTSKISEQSSRIAELEKQLADLKSKND